MRSDRIAQRWYRRRDLSLGEVAADHTTQPDIARVLVKSLVPVHADHAGGQNVRPVFRGLA